MATGDGGARVKDPDDDKTPPIPEKDRDWTNTYKPLAVDAGNLFEFYKAMTLTIAPEAATSTMETLTPMSQFIGAGLLGFDRGVDQSAGIFPEGIAVAQHMTDTMEKFRAFFRDVNMGIACIGGAAGVIAETYGNRDAMNKAAVDDVAFAFADPDAKRPSHLPKSAKTPTFAQQAAENAANSGQYAMALTAPDSQATVTYLPMGDICYEYPDHSTKVVSTRSSGNSWVATTTKTTTVTYQGKVVSTTTQESSTYRGGYSTTTTTQSPGADPKGPGSSSTTVDTDPQGTQTVTTTTHDAQGNAKTTTPVTVHPTPPGSSSAASSGPIQQWETQYKNAGDKDYVDEHGSSY
jgi:hypothetical protein